MFPVKMGWSELKLFLRSIEQFLNRIAKASGITA